MTTDCPAQSEGMPTPRVALIGWCDRSTEVTSGHPVSWHTHLVGVSLNRIANFYPLPLQGNFLVLAIYEPRAKESFTLDFRDPAKGRSMDLIVTVSDIEIRDSETGQLQSGPDTTAIPGWVMKVIELNKEFMVIEPGQYRVCLKSQNGDQYLGTSNFLFAPTEPLSPEQIAAAKSDPMSGKLVRIQYSCKECPITLRVYGALERNQKQEEEGWTWHRSLEGEFCCSCGKTRFPLNYLRDGLAGVLFRNLTPLSSDRIDLVRQYEVSALEESCRKFSELIDKETTEAPIQRFLEENPVFWHSFTPTKLMKKKPILAMHETDFVILNQRKELLLIEIERPNMPLMKDDGAIRHELQHAIAQVNNWLQEFQEYRAAALACIGLKSDDVVKVKGMVIAGRTPRDSQENRRLRSWEWNDIDFSTFDDLLHQTREVVRHVASA